jgi:drug/metabolite transporter (DMT)-like permease
MSGASNPTLLSNTAPVWVGLGAIFIFHERQSRRFWFGLIVALGGAMLVLGQDVLRATDVGLGTFFGLLAGIFYGISTLAAQQGRRLLHTLMYFYISTLTATFLLFIVNVLFGSPLIGYRPLTYLVFFGLGVGVQVIGWLSVNYAQGYLPASVVSTTMLAQPVVTVCLASMLLGEIFTIWHIAGGGMVLAGIYIVHRSRFSQ